MEENIPNFLREILEKEYSSEDVSKILDGYKQKRNTTLRVNTIKTNIKEVKEKLTNLGIKYEEVEWCKNALVLDESQEKTLQSLDIYLNGEIYLQSLSSMIPPIILNPMPKENILDMCAAPGGKTTQMSAISGNQSLITACERNAIRVERLRYNINLQGCKGISVINRDARDLDNFLKFDKILLDAPCSGSGTIYLNDKELEKNFKTELINKSVKTQKDLIKKAIKMLKPGGELTYSTCSILKEENEEIIKSILDNKSVQIIPINLNEKIPLLPTSINGVICVLPCKNYEGFFIAKLKRVL